MSPILLLFLLAPVKIKYQKYSFVAHVTVYGYTGIQWETDETDAHKYTYSGIATSMRSE